MGSSYCTVTLILLNFSFKLNFSFYKQCFDAWSERNTKTLSSLQEIANEVIWNNKLLCIKKKSVYRRDIADLEIFIISTTYFQLKTNSILSKVSSLWVLLTLRLPVGV